MHQEFMFRLADAVDPRGRKMEDHIGIRLTQGACYVQVGVTQPLNRLK